LDFRWEAFNPLNRVRFSTGTTNLDGPSFGVVTSQANGPRRAPVVTHARREIAWGDPYGPPPDGIVRWQSSACGIGRVRRD
jgi:hypothetical protein